MDLIDGMRTFAAAVEAGSFTAAAERSGMSKKLVSKYVAQLEAHLGARLLHRTTRRLALTDEGRGYYADCLELLARLDDAEANVRAGQAQLAGGLRVAAPSDYGRLVVLPAVTAFQDRHPDIVVDLHMSDRYVDLAAEGVDVAVRIGRFEDSALVTRHLGEVEVWAVASPALLARSAAVAEAGDLSALHAIEDRNTRGVQAWVFEDPGGQVIATPKPVVRVNSALAVRDLALAGRGVALCPEVFVAEDVEGGCLRRLFPDHKIRRLGVRAVFLSTSRRPERQKRFIDHLAEFVGGEKWRRG
jgi:DNA-binding transcriptional LysR family regulator